MAEKESTGWEHFRGPETGSELTYYREFLKTMLNITSTSPPGLRCTDGVQPRPEPGRIGLAIGGSSTNWPESHWVELAVRLDREGFRLVLFGGPESMPLARAI